MHLFYIKMSISAIIDNGGPPLSWTNLNVNSIRLTNGPSITYNSVDQAGATRTGTASTIGLNYQKVGRVVHISVFGSGSLGTIVASGGAGVLITPSSLISSAIIADSSGLDYSCAVQCKTGADFFAAVVNVDSANGRIGISKANGGTGTFTAGDVIFPFTISFLTLE